MEIRGESQQQDGVLTGAETPMKPTVFKAVDSVEDMCYSTNENQ